MSVRNLDSLFHPRSIVLVGASDEKQSVGAVLAANLLAGGFAGPIDLVNPHHRVIGGIRVYKAIADLPETPDLAVIATPPATVPGLIAELVAKGTRAAVVISAGFSEAFREIAEAGSCLLHQAMLDAARPALLRITGPNCLGVMVPGVGLNASFAHTAPLAGHLAFVAQSGAIVTSVLDWAKARGLGFSHLVSLGNMADVDFGDMLDYLASDRTTTAILLYIESITQARKFMSAARAAARSKPVTVIKAGRCFEGARAAASHTGALAGVDAVYDAAIRRAGMLRVDSLAELFAAAESLTAGSLPGGERLAILSNGGGLGVLATDALIEYGGRLARLSEETVARLDKVLPETWSHGNPIDIIGDASGQRYAAGLEILLSDSQLDAVLILNCPTAVTSAPAAAEAVISMLERPHRVSVLTSWVGEETARGARRRLREHGIPSYETPEAAVRAFMHMVDYRRNQELLMQTPPSIPETFTPELESARKIITCVLKEGRAWLTEPESKAVLGAYGIACVPALVAGTPAQAAQAAAEIGRPVALKILAPEIIHKSDVGGVALNLDQPAAVEAAAVGMLKRVAALCPQARIDGFIVQPMVQRPGSLELIVGVIDDRQFGPLLLFGHGGVAVEVINDKALGLPPLNLHLARELMRGTRVYKLLEGYRGQPGADLEAIALTLVRLSQLVIDIGEIVELDINPLLADADGVLGLDARIKVRATRDHPHQRLAICPYPKALEEEVPLGDGRTLWLRPIVPEDEPALQRVFASLTMEEIRLRFFLPMKVLSHVSAARFTQIDYDREMALLLTEPGIPGVADIYGVVRIIADPDLEKAEFALIVHHEMTGLGLGVFLLRRIIDYAKARGIGELYGDVLADNRTMLKLCEVMGFTRSRSPEDFSIMRVTLKLA
ncbi:MAG: bifunctional acetate--CoA ligase family protein/GNAT family N-acetyltransferase [Deltaproteobacteria bacterium]|nr:bifunctional acetate--CoA ligase family protein/GNAT family N-acetyltransferase [Deltaproteobacteria bacterium]